MSKFSYSTIASAPARPNKVTDTVAIGAIGIKTARKTSSVFSANAPNPWDTIFPTYKTFGSDKVWDNTKCEEVTASVDVGRTDRVAEISARKSNPKRHLVSVVGNWYKKNNSWAKLNGSRNSLASFIPEHDASKCQVGVVIAESNDTPFRIQFLYGGETLQHIHDRARDEFYLPLSTKIMTSDINMKKPNLHGCAEIILKREKGSHLEEVYDNHCCYAKNVLLFALETMESKHKDYQLNIGNDVKKQKYMSSSIAHVSVETTETKRFITTTIKVSFFEQQTDLSMFNMFTPLYCCHRNKIDDNARARRAYAIEIPDDCL